MKYLAFDVQQLQNKITGGGKTSEIFSPQSGLGVTGRPETLYIRLVYFFTWTIGILALIVLIYGGLMYITAGGEADKAEKGKKAIIGAIIGMVIVMLSYTAYHYSLDALQNGPAVENVESPNL